MCIYDRAGKLWSEPSGDINSANAIAGRLHALIGNADFDGPVIFAGHSIAGIYGRALHANWPEDVAGMIFLDSAHPGQLERIEAVMPDLPQPDIASIEMQVSMFRWMARLGISRFFHPLREDLIARNVLTEGQRKALIWVSNQPQAADGIVADMKGVELTYEEGKQFSDLGDLPILVLTADPVANRLPPEFGNKEDFLALWWTMQQELAALSTDSRHHIVEGADHGGMLGVDKVEGQMRAHIIDLLDRIKAAKEASR